MKWVALSCYLVLTISLQVADTSKYMVDVCGKANSDKALLYTLIPNVLIFGLLVAILVGFPGWKAPFSNTLGYIAAKGSGIKLSAAQIKKLKENLSAEDFNKLDFDRTGVQSGQINYGVGQRDNKSLFRKVFKSI